MPAAATFWDGGRTPYLKDSDMSLQVYYDRDPQLRDPHFQSIRHGGIT